MYRKNIIPSLVCLLLVFISSFNLLAQNSIDTSKIKIVDFGNDGSSGATIFYSEILASNFTGIKYVSHDMQSYIFNDADFGNYDFLENKKPPIKIIFKVEYKLGVKTKVEGFYQNGEKWYEIYFNRTGRNGVIRQWHNNGQKKTFTVYENSEKIRSDSNWYNNGNIKSTTEVIDNERIYKAWYKNGLLANETIHPDTASDSFYEKNYYPTGELSMKGNYNNGVQPITFYYKNGNIGKKGNILNASPAKVG